MSGTATVLVALGEAATVAAVRAAVERHGGRVVRRDGDLVVARFESAHAGVSAATAAQQAVHQAVHGSATTLRVGVNAGDVADHDDGLHEVALVAEALAGAALAGEVLVAEVVRILVGTRSEIVFESAALVAVTGIAEPIASSSVPWAPLDHEPTLRVIIADDAALIRRGIVRVLDDAGFQVIADVGDAEQLLAAVDADPPDLVITDIRMPPTNTDEGLRAAAAIRAQHPDVAVLVLSQHVEGRAAAALLDGRPAGIGYVLKERVSALDEFVAACHEVAGGGSVIDPLVTAELFQRRRHDEALARLTERERTVLELMAHGRSNSAIAGELFLSAKTVESHVRAIFQKLDLEETPEGNRRVQAVLHWLQPS